MATLVITEGAEKGRKFALTNALTSFGRDDTCTFQILDDTVSRTHLQVLLKDGRHMAGDYRSSNGVFVNDKQIVGHAPLTDGDRIRIGDTTLTYHASELGDTTARPESSPKKKGEWESNTLERR